MPMKCILTNYDICIIAEVRSNNTSMSYEVILKTGLLLMGDSTSGDCQGTTQNKLSKKPCNSRTTGYKSARDGHRGGCRNMAEYSGSVLSADWSKITITHTLGYDLLKLMG